MSADPHDGQPKSILGAAPTSTPLDAQMREAVAEYLRVLHDDQPLGDRARMLRGRITTLACMLFGAASPASALVTGENKK
jgi:hypothetical protein